MRGAWGWGVFFGRGVGGIVMASDVVVIEGGWEGVWEVPFSV